MKVDAAGHLYKICNNRAEKVYEEDGTETTPRHIIIRMHDMETRWRHMDILEAAGRQLNDILHDGYHDRLCYDPHYVSFEDGLYHHQTKEFVKREDFSEEMHNIVAVGHKPKCFPAVCDAPKQMKLEKYARKCHKEMIRKEENLIIRDVRRM